MIKLLFLSLFISSSGFAATLLMHKSDASGFVPPEFRFFKSCNIYREGYASIKIVRANRPTQYYTRYFSRPVNLYIQGLLRAARYGRIESVPAVCDAGSKLLYGYQNNWRFILDENKDCVSHYVNKSPATAYLKQRATAICTF